MDEGERENIEKIVKQIKQGNYDLLDELYINISIALRHIALKYLHNEFDSQDLVQDFWADIYEIIDSYHYHKNAYGYLCKVMRNRAIDRFKYFNHNQKVTIEFVDYSALQNNANTSLDILELQIAVEQAMQYLSESQKIIIQAVFFEKRTVREIASEIKMSKSTVGRQKQEAIEILKEHLE